MPRYRYAGDAPVPDEGNELVHPGDVREYDEEPGWGPWELLPEPEGKAPPAGNGGGEQGEDTPPVPVPPAPSLNITPPAPKGK